MAGAHTNAEQPAENVGHFAHAITDRIGAGAETFIHGVHLRISHLAGIPEEWRALNAVMLADGLTWPKAIALAILAAGAGALVWFGLARLLALIIPGVRGLGRGVITLLLALVLVGVSIRLSTHDAMLRTLLTQWSLVTIVAMAGRTALGALLGAAWAPEARRQELLNFRWWMIFAFTWGMAGIALTGCLRFWNAGLGLRDATASLAASLPMIALVIFAYLRHRSAVSASVAGPPPQGKGRLRFARAWPWIASLASLATFLALQVSITAQHALPGMPLLLTLLLVLMGPHIDAALATWAHHQRERGDVSPVATALYITCRFAFLMAAAGALAHQWALPALDTLGVNTAVASKRALWIGAVCLVAGWFWNLTSVAFTRLSRRGAGHGDAGAAHEDGPPSPQTRLETLYPLLSGTARAMIALVVVLIVLALMSVNIWPIVTGLSVFGLAISFGSQALVKDIVSGLFFLVDDAFRVGEYIETSGAKGAVERISIRSVSLRHPRGSIATIPYGQIGKIQNYSRDWVIEKLAFRVAFDTDMEKVRKLFKKIGADLSAAPEFEGDLLETFKSQGIASVEDGTLVIRGKFKAKAGKQFMIRRRVFQSVQQAFRENGIVAVPKPMILGAPPMTGAAPPTMAASAPPTPTPAQDFLQEASPQQADPAPPAAAQVAAAALGLAAVAQAAVPSADADTAPAEAQPQTETPARP